MKTILSLVRAELVRRLALATGFLTFLALAAGSVYSQGAADTSGRFFNRQEFIEQDIRRRLDANIPTRQQALVQVGGYFLPQWQQVRDNSDRSGITDADLRLWTQMNVDEVHRIYARMKMIYSHYSDGEQLFGKDDVFTRPRLDEGFYEIDIFGALRKYGKVNTPPGQLNLALGRQYIELGNGVALSHMLDGGVVRADLPGWRVTALFAQTNTSEDNIDHSPLVSDHQDRVFGGIQVEYFGLAGHTPFAYFYRQDDNTGTSPIDDFQQGYNYDTNYFGFGSRGDIVQNLRYATEIIFETGRGPVQASLNRTSEVRAFAFDQVLEYYFRHALEPVVSVEYALATGDDDRDSATNAIGGNRQGGDNAFQGFGYLNTGYAYAPEFTNLQFVRTGGRFKPLPTHKVFDRLELGADHFFYLKQQEGGPVTDVRASRGTHYLGHEVDLYANWRILSDLSMTLRYGHFWGGGAYPRSQSISYIYTGLLYSF